jgi:uncharacterized repeat protein (TIGR02543 family)
VRNRTLTFVLVLVLALPALPLLARPAWERAAQPLLDRLTAAPAPVLPFELAPPGAPDGVVATLSGIGDAARLWVWDDGELVLQAGPGTVRIRPVAGSGTVLAGPPSPTVVRRYAGPPGQWRDPVPTAQWLELRQLWPGVDLRLVPRPGGFEKLLTLAPGRGAEGVAFEVAGATPQLDADGTLALTTEEGTVFRVAAPQAFQPRADGGHDLIPAAYWVAGQRYGVQLLAPPDPTRPVVIDPLVAATFVGGSNTDYLSDMVWGTNSVLLLAVSDSADFPAASNAPSGQKDALLVMLDPTLQHVQWATYLGGSADESPTSMTVDASNGSIYAVGQTRSSDFPGTAVGPLGGSMDAFAARFNPDGSLAWSLRIGGSVGAWYESFADVAVSPNGQTVYAAGMTNSDWLAAGIPNGRFDTSYQGSVFAAVIVALGAADGQVLGWTYNTAVIYTDSAAFGIDASADAVYVVGSSNCCVHITVNAFDTRVSRTALDGWIAVFSPDLSTLQFGSYIGGSGPDGAKDVRYLGTFCFAAGVPCPQEPEPAVVVAGVTESSDFPVTMNARQPNLAGGQDVFLAVVAPTRPSTESLAYSTYIGQPFWSISPSNSDALVSYDGLTLSMITRGPLSTDWILPDRSFFDDTFNGSLGRANLLVMVLPIKFIWGENQPVEFFVDPATYWSYFWVGLGDYYGGDASSVIEVVSEGDVSVSFTRISVASFRGASSRDGLPDNFLPVGPSGVLQVQPRNVQWDLHVGKYEQLGPYRLPNRSSSAQLTVVGQGSVVSSVWDWDGPTALRFNQTGPGTQSITTASQRPFLNQLVWLAATPDPGWTFRGWSGDCTGTNPTIQVTVDTDFACTATFVQSGGGADLVVASLQATPQGGSTYAVMARVANQGTAASPATRIRFVLNATGAPAGRYAAEVPVAALNAGQSLTVTVRVTLQGSERFVVAIVDPLNQVPETNEANNGRFLRLR